MRGSAEAINLQHLLAALAFSHVVGVQILPACCASFAMVKMM